jgi:hypothetical protein
MIGGRQISTPVGHRLPRNSAQVSATLLQYPLCPAYFLLCPNSRLGKALKDCCRSPSKADTGLKMTVLRQLLHAWLNAMACGFLFLLLSVHGETPAGGEGTMVRFVKLCTGIT